MTQALPKDVYENIKRFCAEGDSFAEEERYDDAISRFEQALALLPLPREHWEAATWIYTALGDVYFLAGKFEKSPPSVNDCHALPKLA